MIFTRGSRYDLQMLNTIMGKFEECSERLYYQGTHKIQ